MPIFKVKITRITKEIFEYRNTAPDFEAAYGVALTDSVEAGETLRPIPPGQNRKSVDTKTQVKVKEIRCRTS